MIVFLAIGLVLPLVFLSSLIIFCVVEVGLIIYITYPCQFLISLCFEWYDVACPIHHSSDYFPINILATKKVALRNWNTAAFKMM